MMAGAGVSISGAGMLRARRRDVSVKPNRKLDRKSSRGMIYENEELRLRTININAEVEQGQNDIKKLRKENEQLRHEIWSLRDEYDKLEEILKSQKSREDSEDYEDRSEPEDRNDEDKAEECSDYSDEEAEEDCDEKEKEFTESYEKDSRIEADKDERLENAENQKISSEKISGNSNHRLHVEFDDLSVVDEEDELKKDKEPRDAMTPDKKGGKNAKEIDLTREKSRNVYQCFPPSYSSPEASGFVNSYYPDRSLVYPNAEGTDYQGILQIEPSSMLLTQCPSPYDDRFSPNVNCEPLGVANMPPDYDENFRRNQMTYGSQIGWQNNIFRPHIGFQTSGSHEADLMAAQVSTMSPIVGYDSPGQSNKSTRSMSTVRAGSLPRGAAIGDRLDSTGRITEGVPDAILIPSLSQRRNRLTRQPNHHSETIIPGGVGSSDSEVPAWANGPTRNGWDFGNAKILRDANDRRTAEEEHMARSGSRGNVVDSEDHQRLTDSTISAGDRPKHFFAPLLTKIQHERQDSGDKMSTGTMNFIDSLSAVFRENFGTGKSSSSDRTNSTVISARRVQPRSQLSPTLMAFLTDNGAKGPADVCVNGGIAASANEQSDRRSNEERSYKSSENLFIEDKGKSRGSSSSKHGSNNPLVKSVSCQDLTSEQVQNSLFEMTRSFQANGKCQKLAKSDNTLDNPLIGSDKPFRSQLNVTLKLPAKNGCGSGSIDSREHERYSPETPEIPKLPTIDYRFFNNPFLKTFDATSGIYANYDITNPVTRPLAIQVNESSPERGKILQQHQPSIDYSRSALTQSFARLLNPEESMVKQIKTYGAINEIESDRHPSSLSSATCQMPNIDPRIIGNPVKQRQDVQVTSFEAPNPRSLRPGLTSYDIDPLRILSVPTTMNPQMTNYPKLYQNVPFVPGTPGLFCSGSQNAMRMFYENQTQKVPAQTQTSIDGGSSHETETVEEFGRNSKISDTENHSTPASPNSPRRRRTMRKERVDQATSNRSLSPAAQRRRLRKQSSVDTVDAAVERNKTGNKTRQLSPTMTNTTTTTTTSDHMEEKNESRSSSSGQESPRKDHNRRVSMYFNSKKRPSIGSVRTKSFSVDNSKDNFRPRAGGETSELTNSERERTHSTSSREAAAKTKTRRSSISSGKLPWCSCWGNGCV